MRDDKDSNKIWHWEVGDKDGTAAAFANDHLACGALLQAVQHGVEVPQRLALLGFGDFALARQLQPALSSVALPRMMLVVHASAADAVVVKPLKVAVTVLAASIVTVHVPVPVQAPLQPAKEEPFAAVGRVYQG